MEKQAKRQEREWEKENVQYYKQNKYISKTKIRKRRIERKEQGILEREVPVIK